jgi:hypothetical protein
MNRHLVGFFILLGLIGYSLGWVIAEFTKAVF